MIYYTFYFTIGRRKDL